MSGEISAEWIPNKRHFLFRNGETKLAYARSHGDDRRWDVFDASYAKLLEIEATSGEAAVEQVTAMLSDGSLKERRRRSDEAKTAARDAHFRRLHDAFESSEYQKAKEAELRTIPSQFDGFLRPAIPVTRETHRLLRAVAMRRSAKIPGEQPSIGALIEELVNHHRAELEREAGAFHKKELAKKR